jgi:hypothetical protein
MVDPQIYEKGAVTAVGWEHWTAAQFGCNRNT